MNSIVHCSETELNFLLKESEYETKGLVREILLSLFLKVKNMNFLVVVTYCTLEYYVEIAKASQPPESLESQRCQLDFNSRFTSSFHFTEL